MECIRNFNRFELKYLVSTSLIEPLECEFQKYLIPDHHGDKKGWYALKSFYYDTDDYQFYREKIDGVKYRRKLRIRYYEKEKEKDSYRRRFCKVRINQLRPKDNFGLFWCLKFLPKGFLRIFSEHHKICFFFVFQI